MGPTSSLKVLINPMNTLSRDLIHSKRSCLENEISAWEFEGSWMFRLRTHKLRIRAFSELGLGTTALGPGDFPTLPHVNVNMYPAFWNKWSCWGL